MCVFDGNGFTMAYLAVWIRNVVPLGSSAITARESTRSLLGSSEIERKIDNLHNVVARAPALLEPSVAILSALALWV